LHEWDHFDEIDPGLTERIAAAGASYFRSLGLPYPIIFIGDVRFRFVSGAWLECADQIDNACHGVVSKLSGARNLAAHSHDEARIAARLGFNGPNSLDQVWKECRRITDDLVGIAKVLKRSEGEATTSIGPVDGGE
jgi:hypothetical protein